MPEADRGNCVVFVFDREADAFVPLPTLDSTLTSSPRPTVHVDGCGIVALPGRGAVTGTTASLPLLWILLLSGAAIFWVSCCCGAGGWG